MLRFTARARPRGGRGLSTSPMVAANVLPPAPLPLPAPAAAPSQLERQVLLERKALDTAVRAAGALHEVMRDARILAERVLQGRLETQWKRALAEALAAEQARCLRHAPGVDRSIYGAYIVLLEPEVLAHIAIREALAAGLGPEQGTPTVRLAMTMGTAVEHACAAALADSARSGLSSAIRKALESDRRVASVNWRRSTAHSVAMGGMGSGAPGAGRGSGGAAAGTSHRRASAELVLAQSSEVDWPPVVRLKVGAALLELLRRCALIPVDPATHRLMEEEEIYVGAVEGTLAGEAGLVSSSSSSSSSKEAVVFPTVRDPVTPRDGVLVRSSDDAPAGASDAWLVGTPATKGHPQGVAHPGALRAAPDGHLPLGERAQRVTDRARRLGTSLKSPMVSVTSAHAGEVMEEDLALSAWPPLGMRGQVDLAPSKSSSSSSSSGDGAGGGLGEGGKGAAKGKGKEAGQQDLLLQLGTELGPEEFSMLLNQGEVLRQARKVGRAEKSAEKAEREAFSRSVDVGLSSSSSSSSGGSSDGTSAGGAAVVVDTVEAELAGSSSASSSTSASSPSASSSTVKSSSSSTGGGGRGSSEPGQATTQAANTVRLAQSLASQVAASTPHKELILPDGRLVWAVPAFIHHYVFTQTGAEREVRGALGSASASASASSSVSAEGRRKAKYVGLLFMHPRLTEILSVRAALMSDVVPAPMVVPPAPWKTFWGPGPYLTARFPLMRTMPAHRALVAQALEQCRMQKAQQQLQLTSEGQGQEQEQQQQQQQQQPMQYGDFGSVLDALNYLGGIPWIINKPVLQTVREFWNDAGDPEGRGGRSPLPGAPTVPNVPPFESQDPPIPSPDDLAASAAPAAGSSTRAPAMSERELSRLRVARANAHSLRCDFRLKLEVAKDHAADPAIFFPHNMDFRGRVYPLPPYLNHMGGDLSRGLLLFKDALPLGDSGLLWLQVHLANLCGRDKLSFKDRVAWVESVTKEVRAAAAAPLDAASSSSSSGAWWAQGESPWQTLAVCKELATIYDLPAHARPLHASHLPVHQDGSCNGLQHYAALGLDRDGAGAVNLTPAAAGEGPADVYTRVLSLVLARMAEDAALPDAPHTASERSAQPQPPINLLAQRSASGLHSDPALRAATARLRKMCSLFLTGRVDRRVVKQTVMTSVYGVTFMGAKAQVWSRLRERYTVENAPPGSCASREDLDFMLHASSNYLARVTLNSLGTLFERADAIKDWLAGAAQAVAARDQPMSWVTPLGIPCVQPYRESTQRTVVTVLQSMVMADTGEAGLHVSRSRQRTAFPPNFIHSLDSSHMFLTALACKRDGLTFAAVHDSFWTHPGQVGVMRDHLRAQFVSLYSRPILEDFRRSTMDRIPGLQLPPVPPKGTLDLREVLQSQFFFS